MTGMLKTGCNLLRKAQVDKKGKTIKISKYQNGVVCVNITDISENVI